VQQAARGRPAAVVALSGDGEVQQQRGEANRDPRAGARKPPPSPPQAPAGFRSATDIMSLHSSCCEGHQVQQQRRKVDRHPGASDGKPPPRPPQAPAGIGSAMITLTLHVVKIVGYSSNDTKPTVIQAVAGKSPPRPPKAPTMHHHDCERAVKHMGKSAGRNCSSVHTECAGMRQPVMRPRSAAAAAAAGRRLMLQQHTGWPQTASRKQCNKAAHPGWGGGGGGTLRDVPPGLNVSSGGSPSCSLPASEGCFCCPPAQMQIILRSDASDAVCARRGLHALLKLPQAGVAQSGSEGSKTATSLNSSSCGCAGRTTASMFAIGC